MLQTTPTYNRLRYREVWLHQAAEMMKPLFVAAGFALPERVRITAGFPSERGLSAAGKPRVIGQCWQPVASADYTAEVMISLTIAEPLEVLHVLAHELCHACTPGDGHGAKFKACATGIGLQGPMRSTAPGPFFILAMNPIIAALGAFPHAALDGTVGKKKQSTRMLKAECHGINEETGEKCGYIVRLSAMVAKRGAPLCPCHEEPHEMTVEFPDSGEEEG